MRRIRLAILALLALQLPLALFAQAIDSPLATINLVRKEVYTVKQFKAEIAALEKKAGTKVPVEQRKLLLTSKVEEMLILQAAERDKVAISDGQLAKEIAGMRASIGRPLTDAEFEAAVKTQYGMEMAEFRDKVRRQVLLREYLLSKKKALFEAIKAPGDDEVRKAYEFNKIKFVRPDMVRFSFLFVETKGKSDAEKAGLKALADKIAADIKANPAKFDEYLSKASDPASAYKGGDGGYMLKTEDYLKIVGPKIYEAAFTLKLGEVSSMVEIDNGYQFLKITESYLQKTLDMTDVVAPGSSITVAQSIYAQLLQAKQQVAIKQAYTELVKELWVEPDPADPKKAWTVKLEKFDFSF